MLIFVKYVDLLLWPYVEFGCSTSLIIRPLAVPWSIDLDAQLWIPVCLKSCCSCLRLRQTHLPPKFVEAKTEKWLQNSAISKVLTENGKQGSLQDAKGGSAHFRDQGWRFLQDRLHLLLSLCAPFPKVGSSRTFWCFWGAQEWYQLGDPLHRLLSTSIP